MKRTMFGEPRPLGHLEIEEALEELDMNAANCSALVEYDSNDGFEGEGLCAEVQSDEDFESRFTTRAYSSRGELERDLRACGLTDVEWGDED